MSRGNMANCTECHPAPLRIGGQHLVRWPLKRDSVDFSNISFLPACAHVWWVHKHTHTRAHMCVWQAESAYSVALNHTVRDSTRDYLLSSLPSGLGVSASRSGRWNGILISVNERFSSISSLHSPLPCLTHGKANISLVSVSECVALTALRMNSSSSLGERRFRRSCG